MSTQKTVTDKVIAANRKNAQKSKGPKTAQGKSKSSRNAIKHGLLSKALNFSSDLEKDDYERLLADLVREIRPQDSIESMLVEQIAINYWKLQRAQIWELAAIDARRKAARSVVDLLSMESSSLDEEIKPPLFDEAENAINRIDAGWECEEVNIEMHRSRDDSRDSLLNAVRSLNDTDRTQRDRTSGGKAAGCRTSVKLSSSLNTVMRYEAMLKRDLYRAIDQLRRLRAKTD